MAARSARPWNFSKYFGLFQWEKIIFCQNAYFCIKMIFRPCYLFSIKPGAPKKTPLKWTGIKRVYHKIFNQLGKLEGQKAQKRAMRKPNIHPNPFIFRW